MVLGLMAAGLFSLGLAVVLLAVFDAPEEIIKIIAPFAGLLTPLVGGTFAVFKYLQKIEQRQQQRHSTNVRQIHAARDEARRAADTAERAIHYHEEEEKILEDAVRGSDYTDYADEEGI
jgi:hypothetical protein